MKFPRFFVLVLVAILFFNCSKEETPIKNPAPEEPSGQEPVEEEPEPIVFFTFTVDESYETSAEDNWIILHDTNGELLDYRPYESGQTLEFEALESELTDKINVSLFNKKLQQLGVSSELCEGEKYSGTTYPAVSKGSHWTQGKYVTRLDKGPSKEVLGNFNLNLTNVPREYNFINDETPTLDNGNVSTVHLPDVHSGKTTITIGDTKTYIRNGVRNWQDTEYLMTTMNESMNFKYMFFNNPEVGKDVTLDYNSFNSFDSYSYLPMLPENKKISLELLGFENETSFKTDTGFLLLTIFGRKIPEMRVPLGYLDRFTHYKAYLNISFENYFYNYYMLGPKPDISVIPEKPQLDYSIDQLNGFDLMVDVPYVRRKDSWVTPGPVSMETCSTTVWDVVCDQDNYPIIGELPEELFTQYPKLKKLQDLTYYSSTIYLQSENYQEFLIKEFDPTFDHIIKYGEKQEYYYLYNK
tara:strand:+ start:239 stop:1642 length:1404 start_codon:yes stop_codon:yes gene_type:complete